MEDIGIGRIINEPRHRDAVHIAVIPVIAAETLAPGQGVKLNSKREAIGVASRKSYRFADPHIGVVDPFLDRDVVRGEMFYLFLKPGSITSLRHCWTHPALPDEALTPDDKQHERARSIIMAEAQHAGISYAEIMEAAKAYIDHDEYLVQGGRWEGHSMLDQDAFWRAYTAITGQALPKGSYGHFFSCSC